MRNVHRLGLGGWNWVRLKQLIFSSLTSMFGLFFLNEFPCMSKDCSCCKEQVLIRSFFQPQTGSSSLRTCYFPIRRGPITTTILHRLENFLHFTVSQLNKLIFYVFFLKFVTLTLFFVQTNYWNCFLFRMFYFGTGSVSVPHVYGFETLVTLFIYYFKKVNLSTWRNFF